MCCNHSLNMAPLSSKKSFRSILDLSVRSKSHKHHTPGLRFEPSFTIKALLGVQVVTSKAGASNSLVAQQLCCTVRC